MVDVLAFMRGGEERRLVGGRRQVDAVVERVTEDLAVEVAVRGDGLVVVADLLVIEEQREHRTDLRDLQRDALRLRSAQQRVADATAEGVEARVRVLALELADRGEAGGHGERVARQRAGLIDGTQRRELVHDLGLAAEGADREATADDLTHADEVGHHIMQALCARQREAEARHHFVKDEDRAVLRAEFAEASEETGVRQDEPHVGRERLDDEAGDLAGVGLEERGERGEVVVFGDQRVGRGARRDAGGIGIALRERARTGLD